MSQFYPRLDLKRKLKSAAAFMSTFVFFSLVHPHLGSCVEPPADIEMTHAADFGVHDASKEVWYWDRDRQSEEKETVHNSASLRWTYDTRLGRFMEKHVLSSKWVSNLIGDYESSCWSQSSIQPFIQELSIQMDQFESGPFNSFNDFFIRRFKSGVRNFDMRPSVLPAFAEARYFAFEKTETDLRFPVKGKNLSAIELLAADSVSPDFVGGPIAIARLSPIDYHRFHFPDQGKVLLSYAIHGTLHSVNPIAINEDHKILIENERRVTILQTQNFGKLAYVEIGALGVGKIVQNYPGNTSESGVEFERGAEKGYFLFGASTVIVLGEPGRWKPDSDILEKTAEGLETLVKLGEHIATVNAGN